MDNPSLPFSVIEALATGHVAMANGLLGSTHFMRGLVVHGNHLGRTIGFPTANLDPEKGTPLLLGHGVYVVQVACNGELFGGIANIGLRPTIDGKKVTIEVNIFDFEKDIYGETLTVWFLDRIREEQKFASLDELAERLSLDKQAALSILARLR